GDWQALSGGVAHVGRPGDAHQTLLDVVGLHSGSVEYHQRYAKSFDELYNTLVLRFGQAWGAAIAAWLRQRSEALLAGLGVDPQARPPILEKFFHGTSPLLHGPVVDDAPLSETAPLGAVTPDGKNYIAWLATAASLDVIRRQDFGGKPAPTALLYLMLRHAMMLGQWDAGIRFLEARALVDPVVARSEPTYLSVQTGPGAGQSKLHYLYAPQPLVTGDATTTLGEYVLLPSVLRVAPETADLREMVAALDVLRPAPTARLERAFAEHVDCCTYRLDAWKTALAATRLEELRARGGQEGARGLYLGAFGWLENLRPRPERLQPVPLDGELAAVFARPQDA
ncbi:MAG TPA: hypothetical protein VFX28_12695, partial [Methylomirabilota bacterium]|nr:hypothetical protein [Methylomirabilota bacterium]